MIDPDNDVDLGMEFVCREGGRANGLLNTGGSLGVVEGRGWPKLGIPLVRRAARDVRVVLEVAEVAVEGVFERTSEALEDFFCSVAGGCGWRGIEGAEAFLLN